MLKVILALAVLLVASVYTQNPPTTVIPPCVSYVNTTGTDFCTSAITYIVKNNTDYVSLNNAARTNFDTNLAVIVARTGVNATDACRAALATYACRQSIARCVPGSATAVTRPQQATCNAVMTACNVTNFPAASSNFTGAQCTQNTLISVEGPTLQCIPTNAVGLGGSCNNLFNPDVQTPATVAYASCFETSACNTTIATSQTCVVPNNIGDACVGTCVNNPFAGTTQLSVGSTLTCIQGRCNYQNKRAGQNCFNNTECASNNCTSGVCQESGLNGPCTTGLGCQDNLYCDFKNNTCFSVALGGELCGDYKLGQSTIPCKTGFTCVRTTNGSSEARCRPNANNGEACVAGTGIVNDGPLCSGYLNDGTNVPLTCQNNVCRPQYLGGAEGSGCNATAKCSPQFTCSYANSTTQGVCVQPNTVACSNVDGFASTCNDYQSCSCGSNLNQTGVCALNTNSVPVACGTQILALKRCQAESCRGAPFVAYETNACVTTTCAAQLNAFYCCARSVRGNNFIAPQGFQVSACATPTPTPGPTSLTTAGPTGTGTPVPIQSSKRSSATTTTINLIVMIIAVIAFL